MYIVIEGIKGSGKSTLLNRVEESLRQEGVDLRILSPTKPSPGADPAEWLYGCTWLKHIDGFKERVYARRSNRAARAMDWNAELILGDRSLITSYVTRWNRWSRPETCISRVDSMESAIRAPDHVLFLDLPLGKVCDRLSRRKRNYGHAEETPHALRQAREAYEQIRKNPPPRLRDTQWHSLDADGTPEEVAERCLHLIVNIIQLEKTANNIAI